MSRLYEMCTIVSLWGLPDYRRRVKPVKAEPARVEPKITRQEAANVYSWEEALAAHRLKLATQPAEDFARGSR